MYNQKLRPRRMRITPAMRAMVRETTLSAKDFVYPIFVVPGEHVKEEIPSMPNCYHLSVDNAVELAKEIARSASPLSRSSVCRSTRMRMALRPGIRRARCSAPSRPSRLPCQSS